MMAHATFAVLALAGIADVLCVHTQEEREDQSSVETEGAQTYNRNAHDQLQPRQTGNGGKYDQKKDHLTTRKNYRTHQKKQQKTSQSQKEMNSGVTYEDEGEGTCDVPEKHPDAPSGRWIWLPQKFEKCKAECDARDEHSTGPCCGYTFGTTWGNCWIWKMYSEDKDGNMVMKPKNPPDLYDNGRCMVKKDGGDVPAYCKVPPAPAPTKPPELPDATDFEDVVPGPSPTPPTGGKWTALINKNCYPGHGADAVLFKDFQQSDVYKTTKYKEAKYEAADGKDFGDGYAHVKGLSLSECRALCIETSPCSGVVYAGDVDPPHCFGRTNIQKNKCDSGVDADGNVFVTHEHEG